MATAVLFFALAAGPVEAQGDPNSAANSLFVQAIAALGGVADAPSDEAASAMYREGLAKLGDITGKFPGSNLAVQLATGQRIGNFDTARAKGDIQVNSSGGMKPTLVLGEQVAVVDYPASSGPRRGQIVMFRLPSDPSIRYIKRIVGLPGDRIQVQHGVVIVNGQAVPRIEQGKFSDADGTYSKYRETLPGGYAYFVLDTVAESLGDNTAVFEIPPNSYFVLGDNRDGSTDSRYSAATGGVGYVPAANIVGRVVKR